MSILSLRLKDAVMDEKEQAGKDALICITLAEGQLVIALEKAEGSNERSLYYKLSAMRTDRVDAFFDETQKGRVFSSMIEVRLTTDHDDYWELKYMLDDAKEKAENKQFDELTEEQQALLGLYRAYLADYYLLGERNFSGSNVIFRRWGVIFLFFGIIKSTGRNCRSVARKNIM